MFKQKRLNGVLDAKNFTPEALLTNRDDYREKFFQENQVK